MVRVKKGKAARKHRRHLLKYTKGFRWGRKSKYKLAKDAMKHAWKWSYQDRKDKKGAFRRLWQIQINAACRQQGINYNKFLHGLAQKKITLDRKILAKISQEKSEIFAKIVEMIK